MSYVLLQEILPTECFF